ARHAVLLAEVAQLLRDPHPRVEPALFGHVAEAEAHVAVDRRPLPADLAAVGHREAKDAAHGRGLARAIGPEEADDAAGSGGERGAVEGDDGPIAFGEVDDLKHEAAPGTPARSPVE